MTIRAILTIALLVGCEPVTPPNAPTKPTSDASIPDPIPASDAGPDVAPACGSCACACAVLEWAGCDEGRPTQRAPVQSCEEVCEAVNAFPGLRLPTACVSMARSIYAIRACGVKCGAR